MTLQEELKSIRHRIATIPEEGKRYGSKISLIKNRLVKEILECEQILEQVDDRRGA